MPSMHMEIRAVYYMEVVHVRDHFRLVDWRLPHILVVRFAFVNALPPLTHPKRFGTIFVWPKLVDNFDILFSLMYCLTSLSPLMFAMSVSLFLSSLFSFSRSSILLCITISFFSFSKSFPFDSRNFLYANSKA